MIYTRNEWKPSSVAFKTPHRLTYMGGYVCIRARVTAPGCPQSPDGNPVPESLCRAAHGGGVPIPLSGAPVGVEEKKGRQWEGDLLVVVGMGADPTPWFGWGGVGNVEERRGPRPMGTSRGQHRGFLFRTYAPTGSLPQAFGTRVEVSPCIFSPVSKHQGWRPGQQGGGFSWHTPHELPRRCCSA